MSLQTVFKERSNHLKRKSSLYFLWLFLLLWLIISLILGILDLISVFALFDDSSVASSTMLSIVIFLQVGIGTAIIIGVLYISDWARWLLGIFLLLSIFTNIVNLLISLVVFIVFHYVHKNYRILSAGQGNIGQSPQNSNQAN
ncbi:hypothetical protein IID19_00950 [Patescibacteria group bacterium]|nr:hypothetical protein [Patescibacteria group bacterium]